MFCETTLELTAQPHSSCISCLQAASAISDPKLETIALETLKNYNQLSVYNVSMTEQQRNIKKLVILCKIVKYIQNKTRSCLQQ